MGREHRRRRVVGTGEKAARADGSNASTRGECCEYIVITRQDDDPTHHGHWCAAGDADGSRRIPVRYKRVNNRWRKSLFQCRSIHCRGCRRQRQSDRDTGALQRRIDRQASVPHSRPLHRPREVRDSTERQALCELWGECPRSEHLARRDAHDLPPPLTAPLPRSSGLRPDHWQCLPRRRSGDSGHWSRLPQSASPRRRPCQAGRAGFP